MRAHPLGRAAEERIWTAVKAIPRGRTLSYGAVARAAGLPGRARFVGRALRDAPRSLKLPWHRVITATGRIAFPRGSRLYAEQARRLKREGVDVQRGRVQRDRGRSLDALLWGAPRC